MFVQGALVGMLVGAGVCGHVLRLATTEPPENGRADRRLIALAGVLLYGVAAVLTAVGAQVGPWLAIVGPAVGLSAVLLTRNEVDTFQIWLGVFQAGTAVLAVLVLLGF